MKKTISLFLALVLLLSAPAFASDKNSTVMVGDITYKVENGEVTVKDSLETLSGEIVIPDSVYGLPVTKIGNSAFFESHITNISLPETIVEIGSYAFYQCKSLKEINIPDNVSVGKFAFDGCFALERAHLGIGVNISDYMFDRCYGLKEVTIPRNITAIGAFAFSGCVSLPKEIDIPSGVTVGDGAFMECGSIEKLRIGRGSTLEKRSFYNCENLKEVALPDDIKSIPNFAFSLCVNLESVSLPETLEEIEEYAFAGCVNLETINLPEGLLTISDGAFLSCEALRDIKLPESLTKLGEKAFSYCTSLGGVDVPRNTAVGENVFEGCFSENAASDEKTHSSVEPGAYVSLGRYRGQDIIWRCVLNNENGYLLMSISLLRPKTFGSHSYWEWCSLRRWLNSSENKGKTVYKTRPENDTTTYNYFCEEGFLNSKNFTETEKLLIKTVSLPTVLPSGETVKLSERIFLPSAEEISLIEEAPETESFLENTAYFNRAENKGSSNVCFWLRDSFVEGDFYDQMQYAKNVRVHYEPPVFSKDGTPFTAAYCSPAYYPTVTYEPGVRPAFYLNEDALLILSGSGTKSDPFVIDGKAYPSRFEENGLYGYKDSEGNVVIEAKYEKALPFSDGAALAALPGEDTWGYIDTNGDPLFEKRFYAANNFNDGYAVVFVNDEPKYAYIDKSGAFAADMLFDEADDFSDGYARVKTDGKWGIIDVGFNFRTGCEYDTKDEALNSWDDEFESLLIKDMPSSIH